MDNVDNFVDRWVKLDILGRKLVKKGDEFQDIGVNLQNTMWTKCKQLGENLEIPSEKNLKLWIMWITFLRLFLCFTLDIRLDINTVFITLCPLFVQKITFFLLIVLK